MSSSRSSTSRSSRCWLRWRSRWKPPRREPSLADARRALLERLIDHAPLFPPASLPVDEAVEEDRRFRRGPDGWLVNRFVCPASKLAEVHGVEAPLSVVLDGADGWRDDSRVEAAETSDAAFLGSFRGEAYVEVPPSVDLRPLRDAGRRAKIRCGGASVPSLEEVATLIRGCRDLSLPFKATAGLHHAVRTDGEHGFVNLLAAAVFGDEEEALAERDRDAFLLGAHEFRWRDRVAAPEGIERVRRELFVGFGSCSAQEPADELRALHFLPL